MIIQHNQLNTPSTQCTVRTPEKNQFTTQLYAQSDLQTNTPQDSRGIILIPSQSNSYLSRTLVLNKDINADIRNPLTHHSGSSLSQIEEIEKNLKIVTQGYEEKSNELKIANKELLDIKKKCQELKQQNDELKEELIKQKQRYEQMENFIKEQEYKSQNQVIITSSQISIENENLQNIIKQKEQEILDLRQQIEEEKLKSSNESNRLMERFNIIFQEQKTLNQKLLSESTKLQKAIRSSSKPSANLLDDEKLKIIVEQFFIDNNEECLNQIPNEQQLQAIKILKLIASTHNTQEKNTQQQQDYHKIESKQNIKQELKDKYEQLIIEMKNQMNKFIEQKNIQQKDLVNYQNESEELKRQLNKIESLLLEMESIHKHNPNQNSCVSFDNNNFN